MDYEKELALAAALDENLAAQIPNPLPSWIARAMDPTTPTTQFNETIRSASNYSPELGGEVLYPTIRYQHQMNRLYKPNDPYKAALDAGDYILVEGAPGQATGGKADELSKFISNVLINNSRTRGGRL